MIFAHFLTDVNEANMFLVAGGPGGEALLVDAACFDPRIKTFLEGLRLNLKGIFLTHDHYDHVNGLGELLEIYDVPVYAGQERIGGRRARAVGQEDKILFGDVEGRVIELKGHTPASIGLVLPGMVFTGDALFAGSVGGTTSEVDRACEIEHIRKHVLTLPDDYQIHTGHGPSSTVFIERMYNPFLV